MKTRSAPTIWFWAASTTFTANNLFISWFSRFPCTWASLALWWMNRSFPDDFYSIQCFPALIWPKCQSHCCWIFDRIDKSWLDRQYISPTPVPPCINRFRPCHFAWTVEDVCPSDSPSFPVVWNKCCWRRCRWLQQGLSLPVIVGSVIIFLPTSPLSVCAVLSSRVRPWILFLAGYFGRMKCLKVLIGDASIICLGTKTIFADMITM